ncbi:MAG: thioredoxin domain-containing protein [Bowdeniella nasicola]|nr:thioredoxin domain-containing protein [Bowdeniella nasicola]
MKSSPRSPHSADGAAAPAPARSPLVIVLAVLCAILLMALVFMVGRWTATKAGGSAQSAPAASPSAAAPEQGGATPPPTESGGQEAGDGELTREEALELLRAQPRRLEGDPYAKGDVNAPVVVVEYSDFSCPFCAQFATQTEPELQDYIDNGQVLFEWHDLAMFPEGLNTAVAARAAGAQGKFWEFHDAVFAKHSGRGHPDYSADEFVEIAKEIGVKDLDAFRAALDDSKIANAIQKDTHETMTTIGVRGTPAFIINDVVLSGAQPLEAFRAAIDQQLAQAER